MNLHIPLSLLYAVAVLLILLLTWRIFIQKKEFGVAEILTALGIVVALLLAVGSKNTAGPTATLLRFLGAVNQGDPATVSSLSSHEANNPLSPNVVVGTQTKTCPRPIFKDQQIVGNSIHITVACEGRSRRQYLLVQENGEWKIQTLE
ncbi:MAG: hypothetical protein H0X37_22830 [Herpetosiphonaceae bacterium]|nr:hypothetical protein [Herpetosiphonaceae bacterium]